MADKNEQPHSLQLIRFPALKARIGLCRSSIYARIAQGTFPAPISLGARAVAWDSRDIDSWIASRIKNGRDKSPR